jgi:hypothetical protein
MAEVQTSTAELKKLYVSLTETVGEELRMLSEIPEVDGGLKHGYGQNLQTRLQHLGSHIRRGDREAAAISARHTARGLSGQLDNYSGKTQARLDRVREIFCNYADLCEGEDVLTMTEPSPSP